MIITKELLFILKEITSNSFSIIIFRNKWWKHFYVSSFLCQLLVPIVLYVITQFLNLKNLRMLLKHNVHHKTTIKLIHILFLQITKLSKNLHKFLNAFNLMKKIVWYHKQLKSKMNLMIRIQERIEEFGLIMDENTKLNNTLIRMELFINFIDGLIKMEEDIKLTAGLIKMEMR